MKRLERSAQSRVETVMAKRMKRAAHRRRAVLDEMGLGPVGAHGLSEMQVLKAGDHPGTERKPDPHGGERGKHRAQRQVVEDVEGRETVGQRAEKF